VGAYWTQTGCWVQRIRLVLQHVQLVLRERRRCAIGASDQFRSVHPVTLAHERVLLSDRYDRTNEIQSETRGEDTVAGGSGGGNVDVVTVH
jgi:hypothetical protein